jgi:hypothetical protein
MVKRLNIITNLLHDQVKASNDHIPDRKLSSARTDSSMDEKENPSSIEFMEAMIDVQGLDDPATVKEIHAKLEPLAGVEVLSTEDGAVILRYDPTQSSLAEIRQAIAGASSKLGEEKSTRASPAGDVTEKPKPESGGG